MGKKKNKKPMSKYHCTTQRFQFGQISHQYPKPCCIFPYDNKGTLTHRLINPQQNLKKTVSGVTKGVPVNDDNSLAVSHPCPMFVLCFVALTKSRCLMLSASVQSAWIVPRSLRVKYVLNPWILCDVS